MQNSRGTIGRYWVATMAEPNKTHASVARLETRNDSLGEAADIVFVVGMPRSGTKLLRGILNNHKDIAILPNETHFFPVLRRRLQSYGDITEWDEFARLYREFQDATFFRRMADQGQQIKPEGWFQNLKGREFRHIVGAFFECYRQMTGCVLVGDKSPSYITQLPLIAEISPGAKVIHIIRDPRDYYVSMRRAWGKNLARAVQRWKDGIRKCRSDAEHFGLSYVEIKYEDLLQQTEPTLVRLCQFLGVAIDQDMLALKRPSESGLHSGNARGASEIVRDNFGRWRQQLSQDEIRTLESISGQLMVDLGYAPVHAPGDADVSSFRLAVARFIDAVNQFRYLYRTEGGMLAAVSQLRRSARYR